MPGDRPSLLSDKMRVGVSYCRDIGINVEVGDQQENVGRGYSIPHDDNGTVVGKILRSLPLVAPSDNNNYFCSFRVRRIILGNVSFRPNYNGFFFLNLQYLGTIKMQRSVVKKKYSCVRISFVGLRRCNLWGGG